MRPTIDATDSEIAAMASIGGWSSSAAAQTAANAIDCASIDATLVPSPRTTSARMAGASGGSSNYNKSSYGGSQEPDMPAKQDEIPIIEENYTPPSGSSAEDTKTVSFEGDAADEIDVKDIPF